MCKEIIRNDYLIDEYNKIVRKINDCSRAVRLLDKIHEENKDVARKTENGWEVYKEKIAKSLKEVTRFCDKLDILYIYHEALKSRLKIDDTNFHIMVEDLKLLKIKKYGWR